MITDVIKQPGQFNGLVIDRIAHEITDAEAHRITIALADQGIRVEPVVDAHHVLNLWAKTPCTTAQEVVALAAFKAVTGARLAWHGAVA